MKALLKDDSVSFLSFEPDGSQSSYRLHALDHQIIQKVKDTLEKLDQTPQVYLCARGDCFQTPDAHDKFINKELATLFIVGEKARSNLKHIPENGIRYYKGPPSSSGDIADLDHVKNELRTLIRECNKIVKSKGQGAQCKGQDIEGMY